MVADDTASRGVWLGEQGALAGARNGVAGIECSTVSVGWVRELAATAQSRGLEFLDAPVTGSRIQAAGGELNFLVGGSPATLEKLRPVLAAMSKSMTLLGPVGSGAVVKLINNFVCGVQVASLAEARWRGLNAAAWTAPRALEVLTGGAPGSPLFKLLSARMTTPDFHAEFSIAPDDEGLEICRRRRGKIVLKSWKPPPPRSRCSKTRSRKVTATRTWPPWWSNSENTESASGGIIHWKMIFGNLVSLFPDVRSADFILISNARSALALPPIVGLHVGHAFYQKAVPSFFRAGFGFLSCFCSPAYCAVRRRIWTMSANCFSRVITPSASGVATGAINDQTWDEDWWLLLAKAQLAVGQYPDALKTLDSAMERRQSSVRLRLLGYEVYQANGQTDRAAAMLEELNQLAGSRMRSYYNDPAQPGGRGPRGAADEPGPQDCARKFLRSGAQG